MKKRIIFTLMIMIIIVLFTQCKKGLTDTISQNNIKLDSQKTKVSYIIGYDIGKNMKRSNLELDYDTFLTGLKEAMNAKESRITQEDQQKIMTAFQDEMQKKQLEEAEKSKKKNADWLDKNKKNKDIIVLPSGLQYRIITEGKGEKPKATDTVKTHYTGKLIDGTVFDSSVERGEPAEFPVNGVIRGWQEALQLMPVGSKWELFVPAELGYGPRGTGDKIGPNATLIFEIELLEVVKKDESPQGIDFNSLGK